MFGVQVLIFSLINIAPTSGWLFQRSVFWCCLFLIYFFIWTVASLMVFSGRPVKSVNFSPSQLELRWREVGHLVAVGCNEV